MSFSTILIFVAQGPRQDLPEHHGANMAYHLQLCSQGLQSVQSEVGTLKKQNVALNSRFSDLEQQFSAVSEQLEKKVASVVEQSTEKEAASASSSEGFESQNFDVLLKQQRNTDRYGSLWFLCMRACVCVCVRACVCVRVFQHVLYYI